MSLDDFDYDPAVRRMRSYFFRMEASDAGGIRDSGTSLFLFPNLGHFSKFDKNVFLT
jgi:hypothetical protein